MSVRPARPEDVPAILDLVRGLADYERERDAVETTEADLHRALFERPVASCHVATEDSAGAGPVRGFAFWFVTFSTWTGKPGIWLEDLFVQPEARRHGLGRELLRTLAGVCVDRGYRRFEWCVLDWNVSAQAFYRSLGADVQEEWRTWRVTGPALTALADQDAFG